MAMEQWSPYRDMLSLRDAMDRLFQSSYVRPGGMLAGQGMMTHMPLDVMETDNGYQIEAAMPGVNPDDVQITVQGDSLTIRGQVSRTTSIPGTQQPTTGQPTTGQPTTGQPTTGQPTTAQPTQRPGQTPGQGDGQSNYLARERYYGTYLRQVTLPTPVSADRANAHFEHGILYLTLPKAEEARPKQIPITQARQVPQMPTQTEQQPGQMPAQH